ncbi:hypothetical protein E1714_21780 [Salmonella enterica subsp. enterica serovar Singapore]|nr:hypothetical protein [Salmonella enterica subsp. enterica serovar Singapore]EDQ3160814.1 hypothetical protein [Salmonella enterica subsp. enterica serovar Singapore]
MADRHSIALPKGSQDLSAAFMHHYMQHGSPWFIKDANGRYLQHSNTIPELLGSKSTSLVGFSDNELRLLTVSYRKSHCKINHVCIAENSKIISLEIHHFSNLSVFTPLVFITTPFLFNGGIYTLSRLVDICMLRAFNFLSHNSILDKKECTDSTLEMSITSFSSVNPIRELSESQWETLWLCLMGFSYRKVAKLTGRNLKNTVEYVNRSLKRLNLHTLNNFLFVSKLYGWERYIPKNVQSCGFSQILCIEKILLPEGDVD